MHRQRLVSLRLCLLAALLGIGSVLAASRILAGFAP
jgi:hypothetical protein